MKTLLAAGALSFLASGCQWPPQTPWVEVKASRYLMGTELSVQVLARDRARGLEALEKAFGEVERLEDLFSSWRSDSEINRLCGEGVSKPVPLDPSTAELLRVSFRTAKESGGAFHPGLGPLLELWGFYGESGPAWRPPSKAELERVRSLCSWEDIRLYRENGTWMGKLERPGVRLDLGGIGKGFALDEASKILRAEGAREGLLNFGGQVLAFGPGGKKRVFEIPLRAPTGKEGEFWEVLSFSRGSISVSGNYERFREWKGRRYGHILDPRTGYPTDPEGCVVVWAPTATLGDAWDTPFWVMGPERALPLAREKGLEAMFLLKREGKWVELKTKGFKVFQVLQ